MSKEHRMEGANRIAAKLCIANGASDPDQGRAPLTWLASAGNKTETKMSHTPHELAEEFPAEVEKMHALKEGNAHFGKLFDDYHDVNKAIHRAETNVEPVTEEHETALRKQRMALKDEIAKMLRDA